MQARGSLRRARVFVMIAQRGVLSEVGFLPAVSRKRHSRGSENPGKQSEERSRKLDARLRGYDSMENLSPSTVQHSYKNAASKKNLPL